MRSPKSSNALCFDHFDWVAPWYERFIREPDVKMLKKLINASPQNRLLDIGGGTGRVTRFFAGIVHSAWVVDLSLGMLCEALDREGLRLCQGTSELLPFREAAFNRIIAVDSFHHFENHKLAVDEMMRVLAPGGRLVIEEPDIRRWPVKLVALGEQIMLMDSHFYPLAEMVALFEGPGRCVTSYQGRGVNVWVVVDKML